MRPTVNPRVIKVKFLPSVSCAQEDKIGIKPETDQSIKMFVVGPEKLKIEDNIIDAVNLKVLFSQNYSK